MFHDVLTLCIYLFIFQNCLIKEKINFTSKLYRYIFNTRDTCPQYYRDLALFLYLLKKKTI